MFGIPLTIILGTLGGFGVNALSVLATPGGKVALSLLPKLLAVAMRRASQRPAQPAQPPAPTSPKRRTKAS